MRVLLFGYYGYDNAGDEWLLDQSIQLVRETFPNARVRVLGPRTQTKSGVRFVNRWNPIRVGYEMIRATQVIGGGGGLFQDQSSFRSLLYYLGLVWGATALGTPVVLIGQGVSECKRWISKRLLKSVLNRCAAIVVRDHASAKVLGSLGVTRPKIDIGADLALLNTIEPHAKTQSQRIGVSIREAWMPSTNRDNLAVFLNTVMTPDDVVLHLHPSDKNAIRAYWECANSVGYRPVNKVDDKLDQQLKCIIAMRYHACIYALQRSTPFLALAYDDKCVNIAVECGQPVIDLRCTIQSDDLISAYTELVLNWESYRKKIEIAKTELELRAKANQQVLVP